MSKRAQRAQVLPNDDGHDPETESENVPLVPNHPCLRHGWAGGHDSDQGEEVEALSDLPCPQPLGTMQPLVLMSPADALALLRMAQRTGPQDSDEADVIAHLVKLASRIADGIERRSDGW